MSPNMQNDKYVLDNRIYWDKLAHAYVESGRNDWQGEPSWGIWGIPEKEVRLLPDVKDLDVIELGCGTAYLSSWLARRGARVTGIDNSAAQLETARAFQKEFGLSFPLIHGNAEHVPLPDASFDFAISEYGASLWCDPYLWIPEAARLLRPGGQLIFLTNSALLMLCSSDMDAVPVGNQLLRDYFGMHRCEWSDNESVEFHLGHGDWVRLLRKNGFEIENLIELRPSEHAKTTYGYVDIDWARRWPSEEVWVVRKKVT